LTGLTLSAPTGVAAPTEQPVHIFTFNDFHGRIKTSGVAWAYTLEQAVLADSANSMVVSAGDNIGASEFESAIAKDDPTIQLLNDIATTPGINFKASAVGNHEFDQGLSDLQNRVIGGVNPDGSAAPVKAAWTYLGANVVSKATGDPVLDPYYIYTLDNGITVGVIGAVTREAATLVSPVGISTIEFTDPVAAVNTYADQLKASGDADVVVAVYHDGASVATSLDDATAASSTFAAIVNGTDANVDAIVNGHTHLTYSWIDAKGRPIVEAGFYGSAVGRIDLTVDTDTMTVTSATASTIPTVSADQVDLSLGSMQTISDHIALALADADHLSTQIVGQISMDATTAHTLGAWQNGTFASQPALTYQNTGTAVRDDRADESSLGTMVADAYLDAAQSNPQIGADIGIVNAGGGLRAELLYGTDGSITYAAANSVQPFANNLWTIELTGAQFKEFLEEQWQTDATGARPSRPFLATAVSSNVTYTVDTDQPLADPCTLEDGCSWNDPRSHITSVAINGFPLDPDQIYKIMTVSFLTAGGDNYRVMTQGTNAQDTGLLDRDAWIAYLQKQSDAGPIAPSFARPSVVVSNLTPATAPMDIMTVTAGSPVTASLSRLDLTSLGSPANTTLVTMLAPADATDPSQVTVLATSPITAPGDAAGCAAAGVPTDLNPASDGCARVDVTIPADTPAGDYFLVSQAFPSETWVWTAMTVEAAATTGDDSGTPEGTVTPPQTVPSGGQAASAPWLPISAMLVLIGVGVVLGSRRAILTR